MAGQEPAATESPPAVILLVDDEEDILDMLAEFLAGPEMQIHRALGGEQGVKQMMTLAPDVVVTDLVMPGVSGLDVLEVTRRRHPDSSVLILTGFGSLQTSMDAMDLGAVGYMLKPIDRTEFVSRIRDALERTRLRRERTSLMLELATSTYKLEAVFDAVDQPLILLSKDGVVEKVNAAAARLFDREAEACEGMPASDLLAKAGEGLLAAIARVQETGDREKLEAGTVSPVETVEGADGVLVTLKAQ